MRFFTVLVFLLLTLGSFSAKAQLVDKLVPHFGFMYEFTHLVQQDSTSGDPNVTSFPFIAVNVGTYYSLAHKNDVASFGIDPSAQLGLRFTNNGVGFLAQVPIYLMGKVGANCTPYNEQKIGVAAGIGANFSYISMNDALGLTDPFSGQLVATLDLKQFYINPQAVIEVSLNTRGGPMTGRIHFSLAKLAYDGIDYQGIRYPSDKVDYNNFGLGLLYGF